MIRVSFLAATSAVPCYAFIEDNVDVISHDPEAGAICRLSTGRIMSCKPGELFASQEEANAAVVAFHRSELNRITTAFEKKIAELLGVG